MKKIIAITLLSAFAASSAHAENAQLAKAHAEKTAVAKPSVSKKLRKFQNRRDDCDSRRGMGNYDDYGGYGMMGRHGSGMMLEPSMRILGTLDLSDEQRAKINKLADELKHNNWATQGLINDETAKLRDLYEADKRDTAAIGKEYQKIFELERQMIETYLDTQNRIDALLTPEQLARAKEARRAMRDKHGPRMR